MTEPKPPRADPLIFDELHGPFSPEQVDVLLKPINPRRVFTKDGQSNLASFDVRAHLTRVFGFAGWDKEVLSLELVREHKGHDTDESKKGWYVTYRCVMRLTIRDQRGRVAKVIEDGATGSAQNQPQYGEAHDFAMKNALSYALKRCAIDLGDQFGLSLYNKGQTAALVNWVVGHNPESEQAQVDGDEP